jgi:hypothetical protein
VVEQVAELLKHVAQGRLGAGDAGDLLVGEREDRGQVGEVGQLLKRRSQPGGNDLPDEVRRRGLQPQRLDRAVFRHMDRVVEPVLDIAVERRNEAVPQSALGEDEEADAVHLVHDLDEAREERFADAVAVLGAADEEQVFELIEGDNHGHLEMEKDLHEDFGQGEDEVLPARANLVLQFREAVGQEAGKIGLVAEERSPDEALVDPPADLAGRVVDLGAVDVGADQLARPGKVEADLRARLADGAAAGNAERADEPLGALLGLPAAQPEPPRPAGQRRGGEQLEPLRRVERFERLPQEPAGQLLADELDRPAAALRPTAEERVDDLEQDVFEEVGPLLVRPGSDKKLPAVGRAVLDRVEQVGLARPLVAEHGDDLGVRRRVVAVQIDDGQKLLALARVQLRDVVAGADLIVRVAGEVVAEGVPASAQDLERAVVQGSFGDGRHGGPRWKRQNVREKENGLRGILRDPMQSMGTRRAVLTARSSGSRSTSPRGRRAERRPARGSRRAGRSTGARGSAPARAAGAGRRGTGPG